MMRRVMDHAFALLILVGVLPWAGAWSVHTQSTSWISTDVQVQIVAHLQEKLPAGWTAKAGGIGTLPEGWESFDQRTFEIIGTKGSRQFRVWFLPLDWVGIRLVGAPRGPVYWEGVLMDTRYKSITQSGESEVHEAVHALGMNTTSLVNNGWYAGWALFRGRMGEIETVARDLVARFCTARECTEEAAYSLILLGVPAKASIMQCAEQAMSSSRRKYCVEAVSYWDDADVVRLLSRVVVSDSATTEVRSTAAFSLRRIADPAAGPALALALGRAANVEEAFALAMAIGRIRYSKAAPDVFRFFEADHDSWRKNEWARVLADLRYQPAIPAIRVMCSGEISSELLLAKWHGDQDSWPETSLLRITAPWGTPRNGLRLLLVPPATTRLGGKISIVALIENIDERSFPMLRMASGEWTVDGKAYPALDHPLFDGNMEVGPNGVDLRPTDLMEVEPKVGPHVVQFTLNGAISNAVTIQVTARD